MIKLSHLLSWLALLCIALAQRTSHQSLRQRINQVSNRRPAHRNAKPPSRPPPPVKKITASSENTVSSSKTHLFFLKEWKKRLGDSNKPVIAPNAEAPFILTRVQACSKTWNVTPIEPSVWFGSKVFPIDKTCATMKHWNATTGQKDQVCTANRFASFPNCGISLIVPHKSASSMIFAQFENICGEVKFESMENGHQIQYSHFGFDHDQDTLKLNTSNYPPRKGRGRPGQRHEAQAKLELQSNEETGNIMRRNRRNLQNEDGDTSESSQPPEQDIQTLFMVAILRDPIDRVVGMFNMMGGKDCKFGKSIGMFTDEEIAKYERLWESPTVELIQERFSRFLSYYQKKPLLRDKYIHFTPQARYLGVGCDRLLTKVDLIGRSERLPELFTELAKHVKLFKVALEAFYQKGGSIPPWYFRMHDARGEWSITPCDVNSEHFEQIKDMFDVDFACFHKDVLANTNSTFT